MGEFPAFFTSLPKNPSGLYRWISKPTGRIQQAACQLHPKVGAKQADRVRRNKQILLRTHANPQLRTDRRIFKLIREHNVDIKVGRTEIEIGKKLDEKGETIIAI